MKVQIANWQLEPLLGKILTELRSEEPLNSLTRLKLTKLRSALAGPYGEYHEQLPHLKKQHVVSEDGAFKTQTSRHGQELVFKSEEDEDEFLTVANADNSITIDMPLTADDLAEFNTTALEFELLMLCCEASISNQTQEGNNHE